MNWRTAKWLASVAALSMVAASPLVAEDEKENRDSNEQTTSERTTSEPSTTRNVTVKVTTGKHWIGVHAMPIEDALKAQLNLTDRLIIHHVIPDSPAAKAELKTHDVLLRFGDKEIVTLKDLVKVVAENDGKEVTVTVLRGGKELAVQVKPSERPSEEVLKQQLPEQNEEQLHRWLGEGFRRPGNDDTIVWRGLGPGVWSQVFKQITPFPAGLTINVSKDDAKPAKIVAKKDGKTYETTEDKLEVLPEDIREHVARLLNAPQVMAFTPDGRPFHVAPNMNLHIDAARKQALEQARKAEKEAAKAKALRRIEIRPSETTSVEALRKEVEQLRKEFQELKGKSKETDVEAKDDSRVDKE